MVVALSPIVGQGDAGMQSADAGDESVDSGTDPVDSGTDPVDAGSDPVDAGSDPVDAGPGCVFSRPPPIPFVAEGDEDVEDMPDDTCCFEPDPDLRAPVDMLATWSHFDENGDFVIDIRHAQRVWEFSLAYGFNMWVARHPEESGFICDNSQIPSLQPEAYVRFALTEDHLSMEAGCSLGRWPEGIEPCSHVFVSRSMPIIRMVVPGQIPVGGEQNYRISGERYYVSTLYYPAGVAVMDDNWSEDTMDGIPSKGGSASVNDFISICEISCEE